MGHRRQDIQSYPRSQERRMKKRGKEDNKVTFHKAHDPFETLGGMRQRKVKW